MVDKVASLPIELSEPCQSCRKRMQEELIGLDNRLLLGEFWYWMGDDNDHLESLTCPIIIQPEELKRLIERRKHE